MGRVRMVVAAGIGCVGKDHAYCIAAGLLWKRRHLSLDDGGTPVRGLHEREAAGLRPSARVSLGSRIWP